MPYIYQADLWCDDCAEKIREELIAQGKAPENPEDYYSFDSDDFPKYVGDEESTDSPSHCGAGEDCINAEKLPSGGKVGAILNDTLTEYGEGYVKEAWAEARAYSGPNKEHADHSRAVTQLWADHYEINVEEEEED